MSGGKVDPFLKVWWYNRPNLKVISKCLVVKWPFSGHFQKSKEHFGKIVCAHNQSQCFAKDESILLGSFANKIRLSKVEK